MWTMERDLERSRVKGDSAWVVGFIKDLYRFQNPTLGPYAGALYPKRVGALLRFSPVKGAATFFVQRCPPSKSEKADGDDDSDSDADLVFADRWEERAEQRLLLPVSPEKRRQ